MTDGRWLGLSRLGQSHPAPPPHVSNYRDLMAPAPPEPRADLPVDPSSAALKGAGEDDDYIYHPVDKKKDTLMGLSLRYRVPIDVLKLHNNLPTENLVMLETARIPKNNARPRALSTGTVDSLDAKIRRFTRSQGTSEPEARLYLDDASGDYDLAVAQYREDLEAEKRSGMSAQKVEAAVEAGSVVVHAVPFASTAAAAAVGPALAESAGNTGGGRGGRGWSKKDEGGSGEAEGLMAGSSATKLGSPAEEDEAVSSGVSRSTFDAFVNGGGSSGAGGELRKRTAGQPHS